MKKLFSFLFFLAFAYTTHAQTHDGMYFQGAARNANGNILANTPIQLRYSIHDSVANGVVVYQETFSTTTSAQGMFNVIIGKGTVVSGNFSNINWGTNEKFVQTEMATNGNNFIDMGTTQMMSVPYALYAKSAGEIKSDNMVDPFPSHGYINLVNDTFFIIKKSVCLEIKIRGGNGGNGGHMQTNTYLGGLGGTTEGIRLILNVQKGDTLFFKVGTSGNNGCDACILWGNCPAFGADGSNGTPSILSINDNSFNSFVIKSTQGMGGQGVAICGYANPIQNGQNGTVILGTQYLTSSAIMLDNNVNEVGISIRW